MTGREPWSAEGATRIIAEVAPLEGALLPVLHAVQEAYGCVPDAAVPVVAAALNLSRAEVVGTISFYDDFRTAPPGRHIVRLCRAEACQAAGSSPVHAAIHRRLASDWHQTVAEITVEPVHCLGLCSLAPAALVDGEPMGRISADAVLARLGANPSPASFSVPVPAAARAPARRVFVPRDAAALSVGADEVARRLAEAATAAEPVEIVRTGSRGAHALEPLVEVATADGRVAYGPVTAADVDGLLPALLRGDPHPLRLGTPDAIPFFAGQTRLTFARCGVVDPLSLDDYRRTGGLAGLEAAARTAPEAIVEAVRASGLRGRGGAGFPAGIKWDTVRRAGGRKVVVCNADEGDSGTFADRMLMEGDPFTLIEGMAIAALATGADTGYVYVRSEYPHAFATLGAAIAAAERAGVLGASVAGTGRPFRIEARLGAGAYICGEETALLDSLEGKRGVVRAKPPIPAVSGLFGRPTLVHNVLTLAAVPFVLDHGAAAYAAYGSGRSLGTLPVQLAGNILNGGLVEVPFGLSLRTLVEEFGGGTRSGRPVRAVQVGGPLGAYLPASMLDVPLDYEALAAAGGMLGHGGVVVFDDTVDMAEQARWAFEFCALESCGKCTPCRIGAVRGAETVDEIIAGRAVSKNLALIEDLCDTMEAGSLCAMGGLTPLPVRSAVRHFPEDFRRSQPAAAE